MERREFVNIAGKGLIGSTLMTLSAARLPAQAVSENKTITARQVVERIQKKAAEQGVKWNTSGRKVGDRVIQTVDIFKAGNPDTVVRGIATSFMSTFDVLQRAAAAGKNFIITHEPTFWNHLDNTENLADDHVFQQKMEFIRQNNLVIWRFHDHLHALSPDPIFVAFQRQLGWEHNVSGAMRYSYEIPETTLEALARHFQSALKTDSMRIIGAPEMMVRTVGIAGHDIITTMRALRGVDVVVIPEGREWDSIEYVRDMADLDQKKGLILLAHEMCEEWGMDDCANWLRGFLPEVPIEWISSREPFWAPVLKNQL